MIDAAVLAGTPTFPVRFFEANPGTTQKLQHTSGSFCLTFDSFMKVLVLVVQDLSILSSLSALQKRPLNAKVLFADVRGSLGMEGMPMSIFTWHKTRQRTMEYL